MVACLIFGWGDRIRTCGVLINSQADYQLAYTPTLKLSSISPWQFAHTNTVLSSSFFAFSHDLVCPLSDNANDFFDGSKW